MQAWRTVLESDPASDDENFFDAGGNSILLVVLQRELSKRLGFRVPLRMISGAPTVSGLMGLEGATGGNSEAATPFPPPPRTSPPRWPIPRKDCGWPSSSTQLAFIGECLM
ncbi:acyl carrier protein [Streptomyces sp. NPDC005047]